MNKIFKELIEEAEDKIDLYKAPRIAISEKYKRPCAGGKCKRNLNVIIVAAPCNGFGDIIFATKFARYIKYGLTPTSKPYSTNVTIVTPAKDMFNKLGVSDIKVVSMNSGRTQCRRLKSYPRPKGLKKADLIFIAPLMMDFDINYADVKAFLKESTPFNTIFLSEYGDEPGFGLDFLTGAGKDYDGLLFDGLKPSPKLKTLGRIPYALIYIAKNAGQDNCLANFIKMIVTKYKYKKLQIVAPEWAALEISKSRALKSYIHKYYPEITIKTKKQVKSINKEVGNELIIRGDILSVPRPDMLSLIKYSIPDILVTGDQSVTDVIDCCPKKTIWYQTVGWKKDFVAELAKELPQKYLADIKTSCGTLKAINYNAKTTTFKKRNDFRRKARHELDAIFRAASEAADSKSLIAKYLKQLEKTGNKEKLLQLF